MAESSEVPTSFSLYVWFDLAQPHLQGLTCFQKEMLPCRSRRCQASKRALNYGPSLLQNRIPCHVLRLHLPSSNAPSLDEVQQCRNTASHITKGQFRGKPLGATIGSICCCSIGSLSCPARPSWLYAAYSKSDLHVNSTSLVLAFWQNNKWNACIHVHPLGAFLLWMPFFWVLPFIPPHHTAVLVAISSSCDLRCILIFDKALLGALLHWSHLPESRPVQYKHLLNILYILEYILSHQCVPRSHLISMGSDCA